MHLFKCLPYASTLAYAVDLVVFPLFGNAGTSIKFK